MRYPIIMNGDHAEFERENANTPPEQRSDWPLPSFDARDWAKAFRKHYEASTNRDDFASIDNMIGWFANALMRGFDEHASRMETVAEKPAELNDREELLWNLGYNAGLAARERQ